MAKSKVNSSQLLVVGGQSSVVSDRRSVVSDQWSVVSGQGSVVSDQKAADHSSLSDMVAEIDMETEAAGGSPILLEQLISEIDTETQRTISEVQKPKKVQDHASIPIQYIRFFLGDIFLAIPLSSALEIGHLPPITPLPNLPDWVLGVSNIRGEIVSMVDLKRFFSMPFHGSIRDRRFIIIHNSDIKTGVVVDRVLDILYMDQNDKYIQESPYEEGDMSSYISGVIPPMESNEKLLHLMDVEKLLSSPRMTAFKTE